jgi:hypothetical protein
LLKLPDLKLVEMRLFRRQLLWAFLRLKTDPRPIILASACRNLMAQLNSGVARSFYIWRLDNTETTLKETIHVMTRETTVTNGASALLIYINSHRLRWALL